MTRIRTVLKKAAKRLERKYEVYNRIEVSRSALLHNAAFFAQKTDKQVIPVLKGNAYGHGIEQVAIALKGRRYPYIAVDGYFEALRIREYSRQPVLVMGMIKPKNIPKLKTANFTFVVQDEAAIKAFGALRKKVKIHLELNTGMNRYGVPLKELTAFLELIKRYPNVRLEGVMSHLADADGTARETVDDAVAAFDEAIDKILDFGFRPTLFHIGQSAGSLRVNSRHANAIRLGIGLYGINPFPASHPLHETCKELRPALKLVSTISRVHTLQKGDKVSYGYTFTAPGAMRIGVLPLGYHEGVDRTLSNKGLVKVEGTFQPITGRVCMNHTMIGLKGADADVDDEVVVYSDVCADPNSIDSITREFGLFSYSLLSNLSPDVRRILVN